MMLHANQTAWCSRSHANYVAIRWAKISIRFGIIRQRSRGTTIHYWFYFARRKKLLFAICVGNRVKIKTSRSNPMKPFPSLHEKTMNSNMEIQNYASLCSRLIPRTIQREYSRPRTSGIVILRFSRGAARSKSCVSKAVRELALALVKLSPRGERMRLILLTVYHTAGSYLSLNQGRFPVVHVKESEL